VEEVMSEDDNEVEVDAGQPDAHVRGWLPLLETVVAAAVVFLILLELAHRHATYETNWILIAILPVLFWLFFSGRIASFKAFGVELKSAIRKISNEGITTDDLTAANRIDFEPISADPKADVAKVQEYKQRRVAALSFELRRTGYYDPYVIQKYLDALVEHRYFKWVIFQEADGRFKGLVPAPSLRTFGQLSWAASTGYDAIVSMIERGEIGELPGVVTAETALRYTDTKKEAVDSFSRSDHEDLPVIDGRGRFVGVLNRGRLLSSIMASILRAAEQGR
jgi:CBS domain-containing protein